MNNWVFYVNNPNSWILGKFKVNGMIDDLVSVYIQHAFTSTPHGGIIEMLKNHAHEFHDSELTNEQIDEVIQKATRAVNQ